MVPLPRPVHVRVKTDGLDVAAIYRLFIVAARTLFQVTRSKPTPFSQAGVKPHKQFSKWLRAGFRKNTVKALATSFVDEVGIATKDALPLDCEVDPALGPGDLVIDFALPNWGAAKVTFTRRDGLSGVLILTRCEAAPIHWGERIATFVKVHEPHSKSEWYVPADSR